MKFFKRKLNNFSMLLAVITLSVQAQDTLRVENKLKSDSLMTLQKANEKDNLNEKQKKSERVANVVIPSAISLMVAAILFSSMNRNTVEITGK